MLEALLSTLKGRRGRDAQLRWLRHEICDGPIRRFRDRDNEPLPLDVSFSQALASTVVIVTEALVSEFCPTAGGNNIESTQVCELGALVACWVISVDGNRSWEIASYHSHPATLRADHWLHRTQRIREIMFPLGQPVEEASAVRPLLTPSEHLAMAKLLGVHSTADLVGILIRVRNTLFDEFERLERTRAKDRTNYRTRETMHRDSA